LHFIFKKSKKFLHWFFIFNLLCNESFLLFANILYYREFSDFLGKYHLFLGAGNVWQEDLEASHDGFIKSP